MMCCSSVWFAYRYNPSPKDPSYLDAFNPCLNPQLFHQFPGLGDIISGGHTDPSDLESHRRKLQESNTRLSESPVFVFVLVMKDCLVVYTADGHWVVMHVCTGGEFANLV